MGSKSKPKRASPSRASPKRRGGSRRSGKVSVPAVLITAGAAAPFFIGGNGVASVFDTVKSDVTGGNASQALGDGIYALRHSSGEWAPVAAVAIVGGVAVAKVGPHLKRYLPRSLGPRLFGGR